MADFRQRRPCSVATMKCNDLSICWVLMAALTAALPPMPSWASDSPTDASSSPKEVKALAKVTVEGHYDNAVGTSDAASQGIIIGKLLQDIPLLRPGEVLEAIPGLVVAQHSGDGKANQYFLRGYNLDHGTDFATSVDAVPVNMPTNAHGQGYTDLNILIPELVSQIDYRKGTYFAQNGDFSAAGSADIAYRHALDAPFLDLTLGSYGYRRTLLAGSTPLHPDTPNTPTDTDGPTLLGAIEGLEQNGPWKHPEHLRKLNGLLHESQGTLERGWSADALIYQAHWNSTDQVPLALIQSGALCRFCAMDPTDGGDTGRVILSTEWHFQDGSGYTRASAYLEHYRLQIFSNFSFDALRPATGDQFEQFESRDVLGGKWLKGWQHSLFGHDSTTEAGVQLRHDAIQVGLDDTESRIPFFTVDDNRVRLTEVGVYLQNTTYWADWFRSLLGMREDYLGMDLVSTTLPANSGSNASSRTSPKMSLIFGPWAKTEFFLNYGAGFHSNDARGVIYSIDPTTGGKQSPVPALVGAFGEEVGMRSQWIPDLQTSLAIWRLHCESELIYNPDSDIGSTSPNGASERYGVEWNNHLVLGRWLLFDTDLAYTHARYVKMNDNGQVGNYIPNSVPKVASVGLTLNQIDGWSAGIKLRYMGRYPLSQNNSLVGPSSVVTDLRVLHELSPDVSVSLDVLNMFDRSYDEVAYEQAYKINEASPLVVDGVTVHPGEPREYRVTLRIKL